MSWIEDPGTAEFEGLNLTQLKVDQAYVRVDTDQPRLWLYKLSEDCYKCSFARDEDLSSAPADKVMTRGTRTPEMWRFYADGGLDSMPIDNGSQLCEVRAKLGEFGVYDLNVRGTPEGNVTCSLTTAKESVNIYLPLLIVFFIFLFIIFVWVSIRLVQCQLKRRAKKRYIVPTSQLHPMGEETSPSPEPEPEPEPPIVKRQRLRSLDTFRGIALVLMVFVNYGAGHYSFLEHVAWNGLQLADVLFPWFMWIMGVCIPISIRSQLKKNVPRLKIFIGVLRRSVILFALGLMLNTLGTGGRLETIRILGVLQRFGIVYLVVATLSILFTCRSYNTPQIKFLAAVHDVTVLLPQWVVVGAIVAGHTVITFMLQVPGCPTGYLGPGGLHEEGAHRDCIGGATGYLDRLLLGQAHLYQWGTAGEVYNAGVFDPEGLIGCLTSIAQVFLGVQAGTTLLHHSGAGARIRRWVAWGIACGIGCAVLSLCSREEGWIPVNKNLWSISFVLATSSMAFILLSACYFLIDVKKWWSGAPFFYPGMNSTIVYVGHSLCGDVFPWHWALGPMNTHFVLVLESVWGTALWVLVGYWLYRVKFFLSI